MRITIIGHFGGETPFNDGQTVKTITIYQSLQKNGVILDKIDTYYARNNLFRFGYLFIKSLFRNKKYIILLSANGRRYLFPILALLSKHFHKEIYHYAIGGSLAEELETGKLSLAQVKTFRANWVESKALAMKLYNMGITSARYIPNFKNIPILSEHELIKNIQQPFSFCTFSRVLKEKGITDAANAIQYVNTYLGKQAATLDVYGPIESDYKEELEKIIKENVAVRYRGTIAADKSVEVLKQYYMLLFPTHYIREGMPGTIIDAFSAGVPVIARRWLYCDEMITDGINGYVYDFDKPDELPHKILYSIINREHTLKMRKECLKSAQKYSEKVVIKELLQEMT